MITRLIQHVTRCAIAGVVALLPLGGLVLLIAQLETMVARSGVRDLPYYFPGLGLISLLAVVYGIGAFVSTFLGRWLWKHIDRFLDRLPVLGRVYQTIKQIVGYGEGADALFQRAVLVIDPDVGSAQWALVTQELPGDGPIDKLVVFVPEAPNPTVGRVLVVDPQHVVPVQGSVSDVFKTLIALGKTKVPLPSQPLRDILAMGMPRSPAVAPPPSAPTESPRP